MAHENTHLLPQTGRARGDAATRRTSIMALVHHETEIQTVELFSDLVVVVAIHAISDHLEEQTESGSEQWEDYVWYIVHIFFLWYVWHAITTFCNVAHRFTQGTFQIPEYVMIFFSMAIIVSMVKAIQSDQSRQAIALSFLGRFVLDLALMCQTHCRPAPWVAPQMKVQLRQLSRGLTSLILVEVIPFVLVAYVFPDYHEAYPVLDNFRFHGALGTMFFMLLIRRFFAYQVMNAEYDDHREILDLGHMEERYELIVLIFFGELCFASVSAGTVLGSFSALGAAFGCYLHYFQAKPENQESGANASFFTYLNAQHLHILLFFSIPAMGIGFVKEIAAEEEESEKEQKYSKFLLVLSSSTFLFVMAGLNYMSIETSTDVRLSHGKRSLLCLLYALFLPLLSSYVSHKQLILVIPLYLMGTGLVQIWLCQPAFSRVGTFLSTLLAALLLKRSVPNR